MDTIEQNLILTSPATITVHHIRRRQAPEAARRLLDINPGVVGLSICLSTSPDAIKSIALATSKEVFLLKLDIGDCSKLPLPTLELSGLSDRFTLVAFEMAQVALHIHRSSQEHVRGVDLSTLLSSSTMKPWSPSKFVTKRLSDNVRKFDIDQLWEGSLECGFREVCLRAWLSASVAERCIDDVQSALLVDTRILKQDELDVLEKMVLQAVLLRNGKPKETENEFSSIDDNGQGEVTLQNARYKNRVRPSFKTSVVMTNQEGQEFIGCARHARGKNTTIQLHQGSLSGTVEHVRVIGREELTMSERARDGFILLVLRGERRMSNSPFVCLLWFPSVRHLPKVSEVLTSTHLLANALNESQRSVVGAMHADNLPLVITHGPPGTGKTSTISTAVKIWDNNDCPVWVVAQSNVAVKNIAESFLKHEVDFKLLVSKEFYVEWHEHIYDKVEQRLLRSDEFPQEPNDMERAIGGSPVILCTLSMLSNPILDDRRIYELAPMKRLVIDEASQIDVGEFMHLFDKFHRLEKVCFFGDPKQLPPYGKDTVKSLQSVFEVKHLRSRARFLNTQYRMPVPLGAFVSEEVYNGKLHSEHRIREMDCVAFVDAAKGQEEKCGTSWRNQNEIQTIVHLVRHYYQRKDFCVITPYDAQRAALEKQLKAEGLPWQRVFNVDSFQGNETKYVIISVVRTTGPGFLSSRNRMNVMLTRCQAGMVIVTNRVFLRTTGAQFTLLGSLAQYWAKHHGEEKTWTDWKDIAEPKADMPGVLGPRRVIVSVARDAVIPMAANVHAPKPGSANRSRFSMTQSAFTGLKSAESSLGMDEFPTLGANGSRKLNAQGRWNSPTGISAIKRVTPTPLPSGSTTSSSSSHSTQTRQSFAGVSQTLVHQSRDYFPSLDSHQQGKMVQGRWKNASSVIKSVQSTK